MGEDSLTVANKLTDCPTCGSTLATDARFCGSCGNALAATEPASGVMDNAALEKVGKEIGGRYRVLARLGEGGMGTVYRAEQMSLKRKVAVKVLKAELSEDEALVRRFNAEAELAAKLNHPNTVTLYDFGQDDDGSLFIAMEFVEGESLREVMVREGPIPVSRAVQIVLQVCASISDAHVHGIVHRDLKPDNVMLTKRGKQTDVVRVLDFGIAKLRDSKGDVTAMPMTQAGDLLGTPQYMAPEQIRGEKVDARTDVYAMGAMVYEMVTGRLPFEAPTLMAILSKHLTEMPTPPGDRRADLNIPHQLSALVMNALAKNPADRPASMDSFAERLQELAVTHSGGALAGYPSSSGPQQRGNPIAPAAAMPSVISPPPGVPRRLATPVPHLTPDVHGQPRQAPIEQSLAVAADSLARAGAAGAHAGLNQPMQPPMVITPPPRHATGHDHPQRSTKSWLWAVLAVAVIGVAGAGAFLALKSSDNKGSDENTPQASGDDSGKDNGSKKDSPEEKPNDDGKPNRNSDVPSLHDWDLNSTTGSSDEDHGESDGAAPNRERWKHPGLPVAVVHPSGFAHTADGEMHALTGRYRGHDIALYVFARRLPRSPTAAEQKQALQQIITASGAVIVDEGRHRIAGRRRLTATYERRGSEKGVAVSYVKGKLLVLVGFGTSPEHFSHVTGFRNTFFRDGVALL